LLWFLVFQLGGLVFFAYCAWRKESRLWRMVWTIMAFTTAGLAALSTPLVTRGLELSLSINQNEQGMVSLEYVFVLGGGYLPGHTPVQDVLGTESVRRVLTAVMWWRDHRGATLVFCGVSGDTAIRPAERLPRLMAEMASFYGVPETHILLESVSRNTREHPQAALTLPGISTDSSIGIVTSGWHMRRAYREFSRYFTTIQIRSVSPNPVQAGWRGLIPNINSLQSSGVYLQEWIGMAWYVLRGSGWMPERKM